MRNATFAGNFIFYNSDGSSTPYTLVLYQRGSHIAGDKYQGDNVWRDSVDAEVAGPAGDFAFGTYKVSGNGKRADVQCALVFRNVVNLYVAANASVAYIGAAARSSCVKSDERASCSWQAEAAALKLKFKTTPK